jgi:hypothetical protein
VLVPGEATRFSDGAPIRYGLRSVEELGAVIRPDENVRGKAERFVLCSRVGEDLRIIAIFLYRSPKAPFGLMSIA